MAEALDKSLEIVEVSVEEKLDCLSKEMQRRDDMTKEKLAALEGKLSDALGQMKKVEESFEFFRENARAPSLYSDDSQEWSADHTKPGLLLAENPLLPGQQLSPDIAYLKISGLEWNDQELESCSHKKRRKKLVKMVEHFFSNTLSIPHKEVKQLSVCDVLIQSTISRDAKSPPFVVVGFSKPSDIEEVKEYRKAAKIQGYLMEEYANDDCFCLPSTGSKRSSIVIKHLSAGADVLRRLSPDRRRSPRASTENLSGDLGVRSARGERGSNGSIASTGSDQVDSPFRRVFSKHSNAASGRDSATNSPVKNMLRRNAVDVDKASFPDMDNKKDKSGASPKKFSARASLRKKFGKKNDAKSNVIAGSDLPGNGDSGHRCDGCGTSVNTGGEHVSFKGYHYHRDCFKCKKCDQSLTLKTSR